MIHHQQPQIAIIISDDYRKDVYIMNISIGTNIKSARKKIGMTQEELASQLGVTAQAVSRWESEAGMPDISMVVPLAQILSISTDTLFGLTQQSFDSMQVLTIKGKLDTMFDVTRKAESSLEICQYLQEEILNAPANYDILCLYVERTANFTRYVRQSEQCLAQWPHIKNNAIKYGLQIIRFSSNNKLIERAHFAMAWIYIHEKDYISAREHINTLPSVSSNRLQESILAQLAVFEKGVEEEKKVLRSNLMNFCCAINKEFVYAMENFRKTLPYEEAIAFGKWGLQIMDAFSQNPDMISSCRGFTRDMYKYMMGSCLKAEKYQEAATLYHELEAKMQRHYEHYQVILSDEQEQEKYPANILQYIRAYTEEFIEKKKSEILHQLKEWYGEEIYAAFFAKL